jgi:Na+-translocating ferredoxin:NAD+ oxidoreductase RnfD subunit
VFFMMSDPATAARTPAGRIVYGAATLIFFQPTEFGIKVAILSSLTLVCALVPLIEAATRRFQGEHRSPSDTAPAEPLPSPVGWARARFAL